MGDVLRYREARYIGQDPAGAAMALAILITMTGTACTGWLMDDPAQQAMLPDLPQIVALADADDDVPPSRESPPRHGHR